MDALQYLFTSLNADEFTTEDDRVEESFKVIANIMEVYKSENKELAWYYLKSGNKFFNFKTRKLVSSLSHNCLVSRKQASWNQTYWKSGDRIALQNLELKQY